VRTIKPLHPTGTQGRFSHDPVTIDLNHLAAVAAKAKGRLAGAAQAAAATREAVAGHVVLRQNPKCIALDESVRAGKGTCRPGKGIFCNARNRCYRNSACALCEP
jgi:hypothetical protein